MLYDSMYEMKSVDDATNGDVNENFKLLNGGESELDTPRLNISKSDLELLQILREEKKKNIKLKIKEYVNAFTVHGLTKIFTGTKIEKLFWLIVLSFGILLAAFVMQGLIRKYFRFGIYTELRSQVTSKNLFPTLTICEDRLFKGVYFAYCGELIWGKGAPNCSNINNYPNANITVGKNSWSNGIFKVTGCSTWDGQNCASNVYLKSLRRFNNTCVQFNWNGTLHDIYSHVEVLFEFIPPATMGARTPNIVVIPHDPRIWEIDLTSTVEIEPFKKYSLVMDKTHYKRLKHPYPSNCTDEKGLDIFPGKYERRQCIESYNFLEMYRDCGDVSDYIKQYIPKEYKEKYKRYRTYEETKSCIMDNASKRQKNTQECSFPCDELEFSMMPSFTNRPVLQKRSNNSVYYLDISYRIVDTYRILKEKELYGWDQMACEIGGFLGLVIGASVISLVEILVCSTLHVFYNYTQGKNKPHPTTSVLVHLQKRVKSLGCVSNEENNMCSDDVNNTTCSNHRFDAIT